MKFIFQNNNGENLENTEIHIYIICIELEVICVNGDFGICNF